MWDCPDSQIPRTPFIGTWLESLHLANEGCKVRGGTLRILVSTRQAALFRLAMDELAGDAHISFEGNFDGLKLLSIAGASEEETASLKGNTLSPKQDFVVVPLEPDSSTTILAAIGGALPRKVIHVQIEKAGLLEFGACDNFQPGCIRFGGTVNRQFLESLISQGIIKPLSHI